MIFQSHFSPPWHFQNHAYPFEVIIHYVRFYVKRKNSATFNEELKEYKAILVLVKMIDLAQTL